MPRAFNHDDLPLPPALAQRTGFQVAKAAQSSTGRLEEALAPLGIGGKHYGVMAIIADEGSASQRWLGEKLRVDRTTMVKLVDHIEGAGFVQRLADPANRRAYCVGLTPVGREALEKAEQVVYSVEEECFGGLSTEERRTLHALLDRLNK